MIRLVLAALLLSGCNYAAYFVRDPQDPVPALEMRMDAHARRECLLVFMPGLLDGPDTYLDNDFLHEAARASDRCDFVAVDAHLGYYNTNQVRPRVGQDILTLAEARGYREVWMVGISMGGLGSLLVARDHPEIVRGIVLLAPFLGDEPVLRSIDDAGGLAQWEPPPIRDPNSQAEYTAGLWAWLRGYVEHPERMPELHLGVGTEDRLLRPAQLLGATLPDGRFATAAGEHNWRTWRVLWRRLLADPPWAHPPSGAHG